MQKKKNVARFTVYVIIKILHAIKTYLDSPTVYFTSNSLYQNIYSILSILNVFILRQVIECVYIFYREVKIGYVFHFVLQLI